MFWSVGQSVCRSVGLSVCLSVGRTVCRSVGPSVRLSVCRSVGLSVHRPIGLSVCLSVCRSLGLSVCQSVCLFVVFLILVCKILIDFGDAFNCSWGSQGCQKGPFWRSWDTLWLPFLGLWLALGAHVWESGGTLGCRWRARVSKGRLPDVSPTPF